jgi:hypothetical protein
MNSYTKNSLVNCRGQFRDKSLPATDAEGMAIKAATGVDPGQLFDPTPANLVSFKLVRPDGTVLGPLFYTIDAAVVRDAQGKYRVQHQPIQSTGPGSPYWYGFFASGGQIAAGETTFEVSDTKL